MRKEKKSNNIIQIILLSIIVILSIFTHMIYGTAIVSGYSMYPTLDNTDFLIYNKTEIPKKGDIIAIKSTEQHNTPLVKRVIATEGDTVLIDNGRLYINNELIEEDYIYEQNWTTNETIEVYVHNNEYFVLGDNRNNSADSRIFGTFNEEDIMGVITIDLTQKYNIHFSDIRNITLIILFFCFIMLFCLNRKEKTKCKSNNTLD